MRTVRCAMMVFALATGVASAADLTGVVQDETGKPLAGATVRIVTAGMRTGDSPFCPGCWADCQRSTRSDASGAFKFEKIDDRLAFTLLVMAKGYESTFARKSDPQNGATQVRLKQRDLAGLPDVRLARGTVTDENGKPVAGATVEPQPDFNSDLDTMAATDEAGEFVLTSSSGLIVPVHVLVNAPGYAGQFADVPSGGASTHVTLHRGVVILGHVTDHGKPAAGVGIGIVQTDRNGNVFLGAQTTQTDAGGDFAFLNAPPNTELTIYGIMESLKHRGAIPVQIIHTGANGSRLALPEMTIAAAATVQGRLVTADGRKFPAGTRITLTPSQTWEAQLIDVAPDGSFAASGVPLGEPVEIHTPRNFKIVKGPDGFAMDPLNDYLTGVLHRSISGIRVDLAWDDVAARQRKTVRDRYSDDFGEFLDADKLTPEQQQQFAQDKEDESNANAAAMKAGIYPFVVVCGGEEELRKRLAEQFGAKVSADYVEAFKMLQGKRTVAMIAATPHGDFLKDLNQAQLALLVGGCVVEYLHSLPTKPGETPSEAQVLEAYRAYTEHVQVEGLKHIPAPRQDDFRKAVAEWRERGLKEIDTEYHPATP